MTSGMGLRGDRILRYVNAFCPRCHAGGQPIGSVQRLSGRLVERDDRVWLERGCPVHGLIRTMYDENAEILAYLERWTAPTKQHIPDTPGNFEPAPGGYLRGLGEMQTQHTCILLQDIAETCNLRCPTCFTDSSPGAGNVVPIGDILSNVDQRLARENGKLDVLMLSGGEPTLHPRLPELMAELASRPITRILLNTNGIRIARDDALLDLLTEHRQRAELYLQYDGLSAEASRHHRGADLRRHKTLALERLAEREIFSTLVMTAALGVNDNEIGDVVKVALDTPYVGGVCVQPQFSSGRSDFVDPDDRLTHTGVLARLPEQTGGLVDWRDLTALPCSHPHCCSIGYLLKDDGGSWRSLVGLIGHERLAAHLGLVANRIADDELPRELRLAVKESLLGLLSAQSSLTHPQIGDLWRSIGQNCDLGVQTLMTVAASALPGRRTRLRRLLAERVVRISVKPFMDIHTMIEERLTQCCVHVGTRDGSANQCAPFCAVQAWPELSAQRMSAVSRTPARTLPLV
ncbi:radical SAM protein [Fodinicola acaciae]|uniref:radical SAM protein n=1 Tax=Fodinicola acaciae TaxID=2681555 RepID=UPI001651F717|nr:radical SAM protein [Fodinicola acaciae]